MPSLVCKDLSAFNGSQDFLARELWAMIHPFSHIKIYFIQWIMILGSLCLYVSSCYSLPSFYLYTSKMKLDSKSLELNLFTIVFLWKADYNLSIKSFNSIIYGKIPFFPFKFWNGPFWISFKTFDILMEKKMDLQMILLYV